MDSNNGTSTPTVRKGWHQGHRKGSIALKSSLPSAVCLPRASFPTSFLPLGHRDMDRSRRATRTLSDGRFVNCGLMGPCRALRAAGQVKSQLCIGAAGKLWGSTSAFSSDDARSSDPPGWAGSTATLTARWRLSDISRSDSRASEPIPAQRARPAAPLSDTSVLPHAPNSYPAPRCSATPPTHPARYQHACLCARARVWGVPGRSAGFASEVLLRESLGGRVTQCCGVRQCNALAMRPLTMMWRFQACK
ncbi:hypothetical protein CALCODRAFT_137052 [Calocera cornea HHB12733]|uniref:Uncharacterized protein n=1 Tax=Calocera cornea HHB12733 TaxID=1353952 RepID=A0A165CTV2_9BASI|nr:hypothetical protein CALCODRAFT_137052 [Calocera cornea HHB12733]